MREVAVIGGGASGLMCAAVAAQSARELGASVHVSIYEATDKVGRSILRSGNGRCNFSNVRISAQTVSETYRNASFVAQALDQLECAREEQGNSSVSFGAGDDASARANGVLDFFWRHGLVWRAEQDGRLYPASNKAATVLDVLRHALDAQGVDEVCDCAITRIEAPDSRSERFALRCSDGRIFHADDVAIACGGKDVMSLAHGMKVVVVAPTVGPLAVRQKALTRSLDNIRVRCGVSLIHDGESVAHERGELLFRKYGVSGICVFNMSRLVLLGDKLSIDFLPDFAGDVEETAAWLARRAERATQAAGASATYADVLRGLLAAPVAQALMKSAQVSPDAKPKTSPESFVSLARALRALELDIECIGDIQQCQVQRGGVCVDQVDPATMQSRAVKNLYVLGEALDVDAPCGGFNLHWAWASGMLAGAALAKNAAAAN